MPLKQAGKTFERSNRSWRTRMKSCVVIRTMCTPCSYLTTNRNSKSLWESYPKGCWEKTGLTSYVRLSNQSSFVILRIGINSLRFLKGFESPHPNFYRRVAGIGRRVRLRSGFPKGNGGSRPLMATREMATSTRLRMGESCSETSTERMKQVCDRRNPCFATRCWFVI